jgi:hypothetical protein
MRSTKRIHRCAVCGRKLKADHYVYSRWTKQRYCWPGEGHDRRKATKGER